MQKPRTNTSLSDELREPGDIPSYQAFCRGLTTNDTFGSLIDSSINHYQLLSESMLEPDYKLTGQCDPYSPKLRIKRLSDNLVSKKENFFDRSTSSEENDIPSRYLSHKYHKKPSTLCHRSQVATSEGLNSGNSKLFFENTENFYPTETTTSMTFKRSISESFEARYFVECREKSLTSVPPFPILRTDKNPDILFILPETLASWMNANGGTSQAQIILLDCRYSYEYKGGHIKGALNITSLKDLQSTAFTCKSIEERRACMMEEADKENLKTPVIIFYCESSTKKGPRGFRAFRDLDREMDTNILPSPYYPFVYVLKGGYKEFHSQYPELCDPEGGYIETLDIKYNSERYKAKAQEKTVWQMRTAEFEVNNPETFTLKRIKKKCDV